MQLGAAAKESAMHSDRKSDLGHKKCTAHGFGCKSRATSNLLDAKDITSQNKASSNPKDEVVSPLAIVFNSCHKRMLITTSQFTITF